jgi:hypothetical protein
VRVEREMARERCTLRYRQSSGGAEAHGQDLETWRVLRTGYRERERERESERVCVIKVGKPNKRARKSEKMGASSKGEREDEIKEPGHTLCLEGQAPGAGSDALSGKLRR